MSRIGSFKSRILSRELMVGTFLKTPHYVMIEIFAQSGFDFLCLDAEHAPFDRRAIDECMAVSRALDFPVLVRVGDTSHREILWALVCGAVGIVAPHIETVTQAEELAKAARFGLGGRGYAGSSRWAGYATKKMPDLLQQSKNEPASIENYHPHLLSIGKVVHPIRNQTKLPNHFELFPLMSMCLDHHLVY